jgi:hypothetical protein
VVAGAEGEGVVDKDEGMNYTKIPQKLDGKFEALDKEGSVRPSIITPSSVWKKKARKSLLAPETSSSSSVGTDEQRREKSAAFDLLDALSRSGGLSIDDASLHVIMAATHCFDRSLMDTVVQGNVNPIERVERSMMIMAGVVHDRPLEELVQGDQLVRLLQYSPMLITED